MLTFAQLVATPILAASLLSYGLPLLREAPATPGALVVVGGRTGAGKSFFGLKLLETASARGLYVSCEDSEVEVLRRVAPMPSARLSEVGLVVPRKPRLSLIVRAIREAFATGFTPRLVVVDYVQLVQYDGDIAAWSQTDQIGLIVSELKSLGRELGFVTVLMCQLRRPMRDGYEAFPTLWDLRDSSNLENSAEAVVLLQDHGDSVEARLAKNKSGRRGASANFVRGAVGYLIDAPAQMDLDLWGGDFEAETAPVVDLFAA